MKCWICFESTNLYKCCNCKNDFSLAHQKCIYKLIVNNRNNHNNHNNHNNRNNCTFCNTKYKLSIYYRILLILRIIYKFLKHECRLVVKQIIIQKILLDNVISGCL